MNADMGRVRNKKIWLYFDRISDFAARCRSCKLNLSCKHTSANLVRHLFYKHHVDASYYGAERTGFLKQKRSRINRRNTIDVEVPPSFTAQAAVAAAESLFDPLLVVKQEIVPMKLISCHSAEDDGSEHEDTRSIREYQLPAVSVSMTSPTPQLNATNDIRDGERNDKDESMQICNANIQTDAVSAEMYVETSYETEKLKAEARYYNEMAELARAKRIMIELQSEKLRLEMETMRTS